MNASQSDFTKTYGESYKLVAHKVWVDRHLYEEAEEKAAEYSQACNQSEEKKKNSKTSDQKAVSISNTSSTLKLSEQIALARESINSVIKNERESSRGSGDQALSGLYSDIKDLSQSVQNLSKNMQSFENRIDKLEGLGASDIKSVQTENDGSWTNISSSLDSITGYFFLFCQFYLLANNCIILK